MKVPGYVRSVEVRRKKASDGIAFARAWRIANKPFFDALYGPEKQCPHCGRAA